MEEGMAAAVTPSHHALKVFTTLGGKGVRVVDNKLCSHLTTYWRQMGHSAICLPHWVHVHMCPHSSITQSICKTIIEMLVI